MPRNTPFSLWMETALAMNAADLTIAMRMLRIQQAMLAGDLTGGAEASRMISEKVAAAQSGSRSMASAFASMWFNPPRSAAAIERRVTAAVADGVRPGFKKARANARRLTRSR